jgi:DNA-directed RNA polymerase subunit RPC12/RpoP
MAIAQCSCGKRTTVSDVMANRSIRCGACGSQVFVKAPAAPTGEAAVKKRKNEVPLVYMSREKVILLVSAAAIFLAGLIFMLGPVRVWRNWQAMEPKANGDVSDTITFALQAYLSENGMYNPNNTHMTPAVQGPAEFFSPFFAMTMPNSVIFHGKTSQGNFMGLYNPNTGEIEADIAYGGLSFAGLVDLRKATDKIHITGRYNNGSPQAEINGTPLHIVYPPKIDEQ